MKNILVFPCGSEIGLEVHRALAFVKDFKLYGGSSTNDHGKFIYEDYIDNLPFVEDENFIEDINKIIKEYNIDIIIPAHDSVVLKLAQNISKINAIIVTSSPYACDICRSKRKTYNLFKDIIPVPKVYDFDEIKETDFPIFLKPDVGQGAKGTQKLDTIEDLKYYYKSDEFLLLEYLPNEEYTIDCFTNYKGELIYCAGRKRNRISNGISVSAIEVEDPEFKVIAEKINSTIKMNGAWFFQLKRDKNNNLCLLEIATRIAGTMEYQRAFGVNLPLLSVYNAMNMDVSIIKNNYKVVLDRALESVFNVEYDFENVYIDLDDTIIVDNKVNYKLLALIYKMVNENKKIMLLSRHAKNPQDTLKQYKINLDLFHEIIHVNGEDNKSKYINSNKSIFIDDSYREREDVYHNCKIPVFDVNMIDVLM